MTDDRPLDGNQILAWRVKPWAEAVSLSVPYVHILIRDNVIASVKAGKRRLITTPPRQYLQQLAEKGSRS